MTGEETQQRLHAARASYVKGELEVAWRLCRAINQDLPGLAPGWELSSRVALAAGDKATALQLAERAVKIAPQSFASLAQQASCLLALRRAVDAAAVIGQLAALSPESAAQYDALGNLYSSNHDQASAQRCFEQAVRLQPQSAHFAMNLALSLQANGDMDGAEQAFGRVIALNPQDYEAWLHRSRLRKQSPQRNHVAEMEGMVDEGVNSWRAEVALRYALAKECEDLGEWRRSFGHLKHGSDLRRSRMQHDAQGDLTAMDSIMRHYSADFFRVDTAACNSAEPIFIVGLPRTGTTLVERILGSHSEVFAAGELNNFAESLTRQVRAQGRHRPGNREAFIQASTTVDFKALGEAYVKSTRPHTGHTARFVDKLPLNFLYCGLILRALPNARIIHLCRNPMDTCYAIYKTLFKQAYPFSYDLQELANYYLAYRRLMSHWHAVFPGRILDVSYEALTDDFEPQCRRVIEYCSLPWEEGCLSFHQSNAPSMTASLAQVRQPVYASSVGRWQRYREELRPLETIFAQAGLPL